MHKNFFRIIVTYLVVFLYILLFLYFAKNNINFKNFYLKFISITKNREIGEAVFIVLFFIIPVSLIIWISEKFKKNWNK